MQKYLISIKRCEDNESTEIDQINNVSKEIKVKDIFKNLDLNSQNRILEINALWNAAHDSNYTYITKNVSSIIKSLVIFLYII